MTAPTALLCCGKVLMMDRVSGLCEHVKQSVVFGFEKQLKFTRASTSQLPFKFSAPAMSDRRHALNAGRLVQLQQNTKSLHQQRREREDGSSDKENCQQNTRHSGPHSVAARAVECPPDCAPNPRQSTPRVAEAHRVRVFVRIRPLPPPVAAATEEGAYDRDLSASVYAHTKKEGRVMASSEENERERLHAFDFDGVFDSRSDNGHLWRQVGLHALGLFLSGTDGKWIPFFESGSALCILHIRSSAIA